MKNNAFAGTCIDEKPGEPKSLPKKQLNGLFSQPSESNSLYCQLDFSGDTGFNNFRLVFENDIDSGNSSRRVAKRTQLGDTGGQIKLVHCNFRGTAAKCLTEMGVAG